MKILICGASGFVGRHLTESLSQSGHTVVRGIRKPSQPGDIAIDFTKDTTKEVWLPRLSGIDVVINAVGVLRDSEKQPMRLLLEQTPLALFAACQETRVKRIVQVSALGIVQGIDAEYFNSRLEAEAYLKKLPETMCALIIRPSAIYGDDVYAASARMFRFLARMPLHFLAAGGKQKLQPVHIDDICEGVVNWLTDSQAQSQTVDCVGSEATDLRGLLDSYCKQQNHTVLAHINIPKSVIDITAKIGDYIPSSALCSETWQILQKGNVGNPEALTKLLGRPPRSYRSFISGVDHAHH